MWGRGGSCGVPTTERSLTENQVSPTLWSQASSPQNGERVHAYYVSCLCRVWCFMRLSQTIHAASFNEIQMKIPPWPLLVLDSQNTLENSFCRIHWRNPNKSQSKKKEIPQIPKTAGALYWWPERVLSTCQGFHHLMQLAMARATSKFSTARYSRTSDARVEVWLPSSGVSTNSLPVAYLDNTRFKNKQKNRSHFQKGNS